MALSRNANAFSQIPKAEISRSTFDRSSSVKTTFNVGDLIPFYVDEVLPGDTFSIDTSKVIRLQTPTVPFMDNLYLDTYYFFVPNRLIWDHWKEFMGENTESAWIPQTTYQIPQIVTTTHPFYCGTVADYMGLPVLKSGALGNALSISALPFRAYALICNEWFRDENLQNPLLIPTGDATSNPYYSSTPGNNRWDLSKKTEQDYIQGPATGTTLYKAGKFHDYFTSALPSPQKGEDVTIPLVGALLPVITTNSQYDVSGAPTLQFKSVDSTASSFSGAYPIYAYFDSSGNKFEAAFDDDGTTTRAPNAGLAPSNLAVDASAATMSSINALRLAFQTQKYFEKLARGGSRYIESIKVNFGVTNPDYRLQRPEYLGGNRLPFNIQQVVQNSAGDSQSTPLGFTGAQSLTTDVHSDFTKSFTEHGFVIGICVARYHHSYQQNVMRFWSRRDTLDYYFPVFANIGEQPILNKEIYFPTTDSGLNGWSNEVFGYQEAWADYRYRPSIVTSEMRSDNPDTLDYWHFADKYTDSAKPALSSSWIQEDKSNVDRALKVQSSIANQIFCDFYIKCKCTRPMPLYSVPGLIDHH